MSSRVEEYSSDENGRSNDDAESEDSSGNEFKRRMRKTKSKSSNISTEKSASSRKKSTRRKVSNNGDRHGNTRIRELRKKSFDSNDPDIKEEIVSDDVHSAMSDINPPSLLTRLRHRKLERRKANRGTASSTSSAFDSDTRKTKSEPILITLDSDSDEDDISAISVRPNRTARIQGEIIRKFGRLTRSNVEGIKYSDSSSSSDDNKKKKKKKKKPIKLITVSPEAKQFVPTRFAVKRKLNLKKQIKSCTRIYSPMKQNRRMKIRNLRKRFEQKKKPITFSKRAEQYLRRTSSRLSATSTEKRRIPRRCSALGNYSEDKESELKTERPRRKVSANLLRTTIKEESENEKSMKKIDNNDIEEDIRQIVGASKPDPIIDDQTFKSNEDSKNVKVTPETKSISKSVPERRSSRTYSDLKYDESNSNVESDTEKKSDEAETISDKITDPQLDSKEVERKNNIESDLEKIRTHVTDTKIDAPTKIISDVETKSKEEIRSKEETKSEEETKSKEEAKSKDEAKSKSDEDKLKVHRGGANKKKKIKTVIPGVIRKRGRPRLSESRPNKNQQLEDDKVIVFLQNSFCFEVAPRLSKCRECRVAFNRTNRRMFNSYCRFMEYRRLSCTKNGVVQIAGFSNPRDATPEHMNLWLPQPQDPPKDLDFETSKALLELIGDQFCDLIEQEEEAKTLHIGLEQLMTWKRIVQGVREMCDVCSTTIFNVHWVCPVCGFSVCFECYKVRKQGVVVEYEEELPKDRDKFKWLFCLGRLSHSQDTLVMTQMIPGDALLTMKELLHKVRLRLGIPSYCKCNPQKVSTPDKCISTGINKQLMSSVTKSFTQERNPLFPLEKNSLKSDIGYDGLDIEISETALRWLERASINSHVKVSDDKFNCYEDFKMLGSTLLLEDELDPFEAVEKTETVEKTEAVEKTCFTIEDVISSLTNNQNSNKTVGRHFTKRYPQPKSGRDPLPIRIYSKTESDIAYPNIPHSWFCNGKLLFLHKADHKENLALFQEQWKRGQPILVKNVQKNLDMSLWHPDGFCRDFGEVKNDLVDCKTGAILRNLPMRKFWEGFENFSKRLVDENGEYMLLKLKDWPPGEDFSEKLPTRYEDLMRGLPLPEYTHRDGILNLAGRLPSFFVRPDLGPKMYNAYGSALYPTKGTTNLHLDVSDAVNVMVYVGIPSDGNCELHIQEALKAIDEGGCDSLMRSRVRERDARPGALWHIYNARDADKIRELLTKIAIERGEKLEAHHDPIHDQSWYLDTELRLRLYQEYSVEGYAIAQCLGDAVFIPAGAPHQVRNLHSCVKVAEDFVSPENIAHCFKLTQEFRNLSDTHTNHEDKLQIKNIIYHVIRDSLSHLLTEDEFTSPK
ncbi:lysine-specific demethylase 3A [Trichonephila inaurata madagascariensis]|uniref:[histone H3]-dimethyl-L-lysine(9) demethylase n=1 Tax=Trichonephila inaurata madagascariensis TaxID=2747483 RepID=A0A8X7CB88_9ARAC|nr:lysine-specific demethylase 3A [Trichonephila inaurata madagascariensis]